MTTRNRTARCTAKRAQVERDILALERNQRHGDPRIAAELATQIAFQRQRLRWFAWAETASEAELRDVRQELRERLGPDGVAAARDGIAAGLPAETIADMAHFAIVTFALRNG